MNFQFEKERMTLCDENGKLMGFIHFEQVNCKLVNIDHVFTSPDFRGQGVAGKMMEALLEHLSKQEKKAALTCSYAQRYVAEHPQWSHILPTDIHFERH